jgi:hypothetical protein
MGDSMSTIINATTTNGVVIQPDNSGSLVLQTNSGTTALTIDTSQNVAFAKGFTVGATAAPAFSVYSTANQATATVSTTKIQLNTKIFDTNTNFDATTNYRFTPTVAGYYQISGAVTYTSPTNNYGSSAILYKNGSNYAWGTTVATAQMYASAQVSALIYCNGSTDYIELYVYNGSPASQTTNGNSIYTYMTGFLARSA